MTICEGESSTLNAILCGDVCPESNVSLTYSWTSTPSDQSLVGQESNSSITISPSVTTTYTVTATTNLGTQITESKIITVNPTPAIPFFTGDIHTCNGTSNYIISNYDATATYTCTVYDDNMNPLGNPTVSGNNFTINWANYGAFQHWTIVLDASYGTGCSNSSTLDVFPCCTNGTTFTDTYLSGTFSIQNLAFNGTITVPAGNNLEIDANSQVFMGGNAKIVLESGATFDLINSSIEACGNNLWDGIYTQDPSTSFNSDNSFIYDAKNAVVSNKGGNYSINQTTFDRNYIAIQVNDYTGDHNGEVANSEFHGNSNLLYPYQNVQSIAAFALNNVIMKTKLIRIGSINGRNNIDRYKNCIVSSNSDFVAFALDITDCETGVNITGNDSDPTNRRAIVGSSNPGFNCTFNDLNYVVDAYSKSDIYIYNNEAISCTFGAYIEHNKASIISILGNTLNSMGEGISILDVSSEVYIQNNTVGLTNGQGGPGNFGIKVLDNVNGSSVTPTTYICDNSISNGVYSITANNAYDLQIIHNTINQNSIASSLAIGILSTNNNSPVIGNNYIESPSAITLNAGMLYLRHGIYTNYSDYGRFINNESIHNGSGIYFREENTNIEIGLNKVTNNWDGMHFENADIGPNSQGQLNNPWNNEWSANINANIDGSISQIVDWYHLSAPPYNPTLNPFAPFLHLNFIQTQNGSYNPLLKCIEGPINPPGGVSGDLDGAYMASGFYSATVLTANQKDSIRTTKLGGIINMFVPLSLSGSLNASTTASMLSGANIYQNNSNTAYNKCQAAYRYLSNNNSYLNIGTAGDGVFQGFYTWLDNSNIGKLDKIEKAAFAGDTATANTLLYSLAPQNFIEIVSHDVYSIYNNSWGIGKYSFSTSDSISLLSYAHLDPAIGGPSVYLARNMLGLTLIDFGQAQAAKMAASSANISDTREADNILVYPNPANNQITIEFENKINSSDITIFNIFGQMIIKQNMSNATKYNLNISNLKSGMYFYSIVSDGKVLKSGKFIKQ